jgi:hypothetical protein
VAPHLYGWTREDLKPGGAQDQQARLEQFAHDLETLGVTRLDEWHSREESLQKIREMIAAQIPGD